MTWRRYHPLLLGTNPELVALEPPLEILNELYRRREEPTRYWRLRVELPWRTDPSMTDKAQAPFDALRSKDAVIGALRRAGVPPETIKSLQRLLPDPVDLDRDGELLLSHGITMDRMIDRLGGSP